jgi:hypothetical protein
MRGLQPEGFQKAIRRGTRPLELVEERRQDNKAVKSYQRRSGRRLRPYRQTEFRLKRPPARASHLMICRDIYTLTIAYSTTFRWLLNVARPP